MLQALSGRRNEGGCPPLVWSAAPLPPGRGAAQWVLAFPFRRPIAKAPGSPGPGARGGASTPGGHPGAFAAALQPPPHRRFSGLQAIPRRAPTRSRPPLSPRHGSSRTFWPATTFAGFDGSNGQAAPACAVCQRTCRGPWPPRVPGQQLRGARVALYRRVPKVAAGVLFAGQPRRSRHSLFPSIRADCCADRSTRRLGIEVKP
jgi:hypothetical protein